MRMISKLRGMTKDDDTINIKKATKKYESFSRLIIYSAHKSGIFYVRTLFLARLRGPFCIVLFW